ncbi:protein TALPID3 isoform X2 [Myiozetetes cayanensis]|uniref:protein TALPID3 isoform X2 n=1 Tax=Myiozetetes cayanensis TaxID=478635 RepID=UPI00215F575D|nr:protein TALPID3 isoform X2 [Myiozetetes cayanensis]
MEAQSGSSSSRDSLGSLTAGEVLIRSTGLRGEKPPGRAVTVAVQKLREGLCPCPGPGAGSAAHGAPPAPCGAGTPRSTAPGVLSTKGYPQLLLPVEDAEPMFLPQMDFPREAAVQEDPSLLLEDSRDSEGEVFISQYATGQKEALRAVLKQKAQNTPVLKEVKVQLLGNACTERKEGVGHDPRSAPREVDSATTIAAATAAAIASTAPLLKVQNDLEAKVNSVSALLDKLQETDRHLQRVAEQQTHGRAQQDKPHCHQRVRELENQMNALMVQRIQHLEKLQEQQMNIQCHLLSSAVNTRGFQQSPGPSSSLLPKPAEQPEQRPLPNPVPLCPRGLFPATDAPAQAFSNHFASHGIPTQKSPLKTPVPRRCAPEPVSQHGRISQRENSGMEKENIPKATTEGERKLLEPIPSSQEMPLRQNGYSKKAALNSNERSWHSERDRHNPLPAEPVPAFESYSSVERTVKKADDLLQGLGQLRREMHNILQEANSWKSDVNDLIKSKNPPVAPDPPDPPLLDRPSILQNIPVPKSILRDAERTLRGVQNNKKVLEENLEAVTRAKDGDATYSLINSLATNRDVLEEIRIRRTVDEWIKAISEEIQAEMARNDWEQVKHEQKLPWIKRAQNLKAMKAKKEMKAKTQKIPGCLTKLPLCAAKPLQKQEEENTRKMRLRTYFAEGLQRRDGRADGPGSGSALVPNEDYLSRVYGKPIYQGHRSTLKKAPYLRFNSPSPKSKLPRPKLIECVKGTKVKSARTQTSSHTQRVIPNPRKQHPVYALAQENRYLFSPSQDVPPTYGPLEGHLIPMAVPLGQTRSSSTTLQPAGIIEDKPHPVTVTTSLPQVPKPPVEIKKPNIAMIEMRSEKKDPPQLSVQVLPNVDIDSVSSGSVSGNHVPPGSEPPLPPGDAVIQTPEDVPSEEEDTKFPGTNFIDVTDVMQEQDEERDEIPEFSEPLLELNGQFKVASPKYNGPLFPPVASAPQQPADVLDELIQRRETIENRLVNWVEQEIMAKIISGLCPAGKETVPSVSTSESGDEEVGSPDLVEVAGGGGFQLFVNAGVPVDSEMINHFVNEALSETIATMLGDNQAQRAAPDPNVLPSTVTKMESPVPTPLPTPQATPPPTPPSEKELPPVRTPEPSPSPTEMSESEKPKETGVGIPAATGPVGTPTVTPVNTPTTTTPSPPASERGSHAAKMESPKPPDPWDGAELPLEEEKPSPSAQDPVRPQAVEMSVAKDEEPEALILPSPQPSARPLESLPRPLESPPSHPQVPSPMPTVTSGVSTQESSSITTTPTDTETTDRPISEGELLFSYGQMVAAGEGGLSLPNLSESLSSTLRDANEMDDDPPSEGQVVRRLDKEFPRDPVLTLLAKLNQAPVSPPGGIDHLEDSEGSVGELSEGQRPRLSRAEERILLGHSLFLAHPAAPSSGNRAHQGSCPASPGQLTHIGEILGDADTTHGPMLLAELESQPASNPALRATQPGSRVTSPSEDLSQEESQGAAPVGTGRARVILVRRMSEEMASR